MDRYGEIKEDMDPDALGVKFDLTGEVEMVAIGSKRKVGNLQSEIMAL